MNCVLQPVYFRVFYLDHLTVHFHEVGLVTFLGVELLKKFGDFIVARFLCFLLDPLFSNHFLSSLDLTLLLIRVDLHWLLHSANSFSAFVDSHQVSLMFVKLSVELGLINFLMGVSALSNDNLHQFNKRFSEELIEVLLGHRLKLNWGDLVRVLCLLHMILHLFRWVEQVVGHDVFVKIQLVLVVVPNEAVMDQLSELTKWFSELVHVLEEGTETLSVEVVHAHWFEVSFLLQQLN